MKLTANQLIAEARSYKNYQEKYKLGTREQMWNFHWCAGDKNYTIWAMLFQDYTSKNFQGQAWCAMSGVDWLVLALMKNCGLNQSKAVKQANTMLGGALPYNCQDFVTTRKKDARLSHNAKVGSYVVFWTGSKYGHWGLVTGVTNTGFTSIEGNTSGGANKVDPDGGAVVEKWHSNNAKNYFWDLQLDKVETPIETHKISVGKSGLKALADVNIRNLPGTTETTVIGQYNIGECIVPTEKTFVSAKTWYKTSKGWVSASYLEGWVQEDNGLWWYMHKGYKFTVNDWEQINGVWYFVENTGYIRQSNWLEWKDEWYYLAADGSMATNAYIKSADKELYYWVGSDGIWHPDIDRPADKYMVVK